MACKLCFSENQKQFSAEINLHFPGYEGLTKPTVLLFPGVNVCLHCVFAEFSISEIELHRLESGDAT
jgi:hypothetical protein